MNMNVCMQPEQSQSSAPQMKSTVFPRIVPADTINLSHQNNADTIWGRILFEGGHYYFHAHDDTGTGVKWWSTNACGPRCGHQLWTRSWLVSLFPNTHRNFATSIRVPASSILASFSLGASHSFYTWPQIFEWAGADTNRGWILFHSAQAIVWILFEGRYYSTCGYYSRKYSNTVFYTNTTGSNVIEIDSRHLWEERCMDFCGCQPTCVRQACICRCSTHHKM